MLSSKTRPVCLRRPALHSSVAVVSGFCTLLGADRANAQLSLRDWEADARMQHQPTHSHSSRVNAYDYRSGFGGEPLELSLHAANVGGYAASEVSIHAQRIRSTWIHAVEGGYWDMERSTSLVVEFRAESDMTYSLDGFFQAIGDTRMSAIVRLTENSSETPLFEHWIDGVAVDPRIDFGTTAGFPWYQIQSGSLEGMLQAGVRYRLNVSMNLYRYDTRVDAVLGQGHFNLNLRTVPSPGAPAILALGGILASRRPAKRTQGMNIQSGHRN